LRESDGLKPGKTGSALRIFIFIYTLLMIAGSVFTLGLVPRALKDIGHERERLAEEAPGIEFRRMVDAGYRLNTILLMVEVLYYYLLVIYARSNWQLLYGGFFFGLVHIGYLVMGRAERKRLASGSTRTRFARWLIWFTAVLTSVELGFLIWVAIQLFKDTVK